MSFRRSLLSRSAPVDQLRAKRPPIPLGNAKMGQGEALELPDAPASTFTPREKYLDEAPSGRLGQMSPLLAGARIAIRYVTRHASPSISILTFMS